MGGMMPLKAECAKEIVREKYANAKVQTCNGRFYIYIFRGSYIFGRQVTLSSYCKSEAAAWLSAARRIEKGRK